MEHQLHKSDDVLVLSLKGRLLGEHQTITLLEDIGEEIAMGFIHIIVDLEDLEFINSSGLSFLLTVLTRVRKQDGEVVLCSLNPLLQQLMITTKLHSFFRIATDRKSALAHFEREQSSS